MAARKKDMKGISRIDSRGTHGWYVRIYHEGKTHSKLYSDKKYGGKERALKFAKKARDLAMDKIKGRYRLRKKKPNLVTSTTGSNTGVVGVYKTKRTYKSGNTYYYYKIYWRPRPNKVKSREWSIQKYGEDEAFRLAVEFRDNVMREIHGKKYEEVRKDLIDENILDNLDGDHGLIDEEDDADNAVKDSKPEL